MSGLPRFVEAPIAAVALSALAPILLILAALVRATSPGPAIFRQERVGRDGRRFVLLKLRTMRTRDPRADGGSGPEVTAAGDRRITPVGRFLRRAKLDELPQLWNVLLGDMSFVGPRPDVPSMVDLDDPEIGPLWRRVLAVRPGLTDPTTLDLRDEESLLAAVAEAERADHYRRVLLPWKLRRSIEYLDRRTPWSDVAVIVRTLGALLSRGRFSL